MFLGKEVIIGPSHDLFPGSAYKAGEFRVAPEIDPLQVFEEHPVRDGIQEAGQQRCLLGKGFLRLLPLGDVSHDADHADDLPVGIMVRAVYGGNPARSPGLGHMIEGIGALDRFSGERPLQERPHFVLSQMGKEV